MDMTMLTLVILLTVFGLVILLSASEYNGRVRFHDSAYYFKNSSLPLRSGWVLCILFPV